MKITRRIQMETDRFELGDRISFRLEGARYTATAIRQEPDGMLFVFDEFLDEAYPMNKKGGTEGGYEASDMRKHLQDIGDKLPEDIKTRIVPFENGDYLRLLTLPEVYGVDDNFDECGGRIPFSKDRRNRIAMRRGDEYEWMWTATVVSVMSFAFVGGYGRAGAAGASASHGVCPAFKIQAENSKGGA